MIDSNFNNNKLVITYYKSGVTNFHGIGNLTVHNCSFENNSGTGILVENSNLYFSGSNVLRKNIAYNGGGIAMYTYSTLHLLENATLSLISNYAYNFGGGLYVKLPDDYVDDFMRLDNDYMCFFNAEDAALLEFSNNKAMTAGNDLYGGDLHKCQNGSKMMAKIIRSPENYTVEITSDSLRVCKCSTQNQQLCFDVAQKIKTVHTYPGKSFNLSLMHGSRSTGQWQCSFWCSQCDICRAPCVRPCTWNHSQSNGCPKWQKSLFRTDIQHPFY